MEETKKPKWDFDKLDLSSEEIKELIEKLSKYLLDKDEVNT